MNKRCLGCMEQYSDEFNICPHCGFVAGTVSEEPIHMDPGTILHDRYIVGKVLGFGGFGVTYIAWDGKLEQKVAIKEYLPGEFSTRMPGQTRVTVFNGEKTEQFYGGLHKFVDEAKRLAKFQNEAGIVKIFDSFEENKTAYIVMEYLEGETLSEYLKREGPIPEDKAVEMLMPVMESLMTVHEEGLIHRDIAPDNIFLTTDGEVKLIDFGASRYATTTHSRSLTVIVKPGYSPEEQYRSRGDQGSHTDVYAVAATLYKMITGKTPPDAMERRAKYENQNKDILVEPHKILKSISENREVAILNGLNVRIEDRTPDIATLIDELQADPPAKRRSGKIRKIDVFAWPLWVKIAVPSVMALLITLGALILTGVISFSKYSREVVVPDNIVIAPDVEGLIHDDAVGVIKNARLNAVIKGNVQSEFIPAGKIIIQRPVGGTFLEKNGIIDLTISAGTEVVEAVDGISTIPYLIGDDREAAIEKCRIAGLGEPVFEEVEDEYIAAGLVISSDVDGGTQVPEGTVIHIKISKGPAPFSMPETIGKDEASARATLEESGLMITVEYEYSKEVPEGQVIRQSVNKGDDVRRGDMITIVVSTGEKLVIVEDVTGRNQSEAEKALGDQGFAVYIRENTDEKVPAGAVISQSPAAGTSQKEGTTITIFVSTGRKTINVLFDVNGGEGSIGGAVVHLDDTYGNLPTPTRTGYAFDGWFIGKSGGAQVTSTTRVTQSSDHTLYAHWTAVDYTVSLDAKGGDLARSSISVAYDSNYGELPTPTRTGYSFDGWFTSGGTQIGSSTKMNTASDHTLSAHWTADTYKVSFDPNGGSVSSSSKTITFDSPYGDMPTPTYEGYVFGGWFTSADGGSLIDASTKVTSTSDHTLFARWSAGNCKVTLDANGGSVGVEAIGVTFKEPYGELPEAKRTGYTFNGWFTDPSSGTQIKDITAVTSAFDHTLYAHWTANTYLVAFNANGGDVSSTSKNVTFDTTYGDIPSPTRTGYTFDGWFSAATGGTQITATTAMTTASDHSIYAHWTAIVYTLSFDANGGSSNPSDKQVAFDSAYGELPTSGRDYYDFAGWYTSLDGGTKVSADTIMAGDTVLYAHWNIHPTSDWVLASDMPSGAKVIETKYTYTLREYTTDSASSKSGWTKYDESSAWGGTNGPYDYDPSNGSPNREVWSEQYVASTVHHYKYYHRFGQGENVHTGNWENVCGTDASLPKGTRHEIDVTSALSYKGSITAYGVTYSEYGSYKCPHCGYSNVWFVDGEYDEEIKATRWYFHDKVYTYYFYRDVSKESTSDPSGQSDVSNVKKYVKYRAK